MVSASAPVSVVFVVATLLGAWLFLRAVPRRGRVALGLGAWATLQWLVAWSGFYTVTQTLPPRFVLAIGPPLATAALLVALPAGRRWLAACDLRALTWLHVVRVPVEWGLHTLYVEGLVPQVMTWEGRNLDVISGLTAPLVVWLAFRGTPVVRPRLLRVWNYGCLALLLTIMVHGVLSVPTPLQRFGFEQPNVALLHPPFVWLPTIIVPLVLVAHLAVLVRPRLGTELGYQRSSASKGK